VARRQGIRRKKLLDDLKDRRRKLWIALFGGIVLGRGFEPVVRQTTEW
jgi:hypothetical protein